MIITHATCKISGGKIKLAVQDCRPGPGTRIPDGFSIHKDFIGGLWKFEDTIREMSNDTTVYMIIMIYKTGGTDPMFFEDKSHRDQIFDFIDKHTDTENYSMEDST